MTVIEQRPLLVMMANNTSWKTHYLAGAYGNIGHLYSPGAQRGPWAHLPYALDNGAYPAWINGAEWDEDAWLKLIEWADPNRYRPKWTLVPDVVADPVGTLEKWKSYLPVVERAGHAPAFAAQDGHEPSDVPDEAAWVFLGGTTAWKEDWIAGFARAFPGRLHVGRVNGDRMLDRCASLGVASCDGTGWLRGDPEQMLGLQRFLAKQKMKWGHEPFEIHTAQSGRTSRNGTAAPVRPEEGGLAFS